MATAADLVIAEVRELVETGAIAPEAVRTPGIFVDYMSLRPNNRTAERTNPHLNRIKNIRLWKNQ